MAAAGVPEELLQPRQNALLIGPAAIGKTCIVRTLARLTGLPFTTIEVAHLNASGPNRVNEVAAELVLQGDGKELVRQQRGVVLLRGVDNLCTDVGREIQSALAAVIGGTQAQVVINGQLVSVPFERFLFVASGRFDGLTELICKRVGVTMVGFGQKKLDDPLALLTPDDLREYGLDSYLVARLPVRVVFNELSETELLEVLMSASDSPLVLARTEFAGGGVQLQMTPEAAARIVRQAAGLSNGGEGLRHLVDELLQPLLFDLPGKAAAGINLLQLTADPNNAAGVTAVWQPPASPARIKPPEPARPEPAAPVLAPTTVLPNRAPRVPGAQGGKWASLADLNEWLTEPPGGPQPTPLRGATLVVEATPDGSRLEAVPNKTLRITDDARRRSLLCVGATGSGKTTRVLLPILNADIADLDRAVVVIDAQLDLTPKVLAMVRKHRGSNAPFVYLNLTDPQKSTGWNPLHNVRSRSDATFIAHTIKSAVKEEGSGDSPFFREQATKILARLINGLQQVDPGNCNLGYILQTIERGYLPVKQLADACGDGYLHDLAMKIKDNHHNTQTSLQELETFLRAWDDESVCATTTTNEFNFDILDQSPAPVVVVAMPEERVEVLRPATACFVMEFLNYVMRRSPEEGGLVRRSISLVIDEFASAVGALPDLALRINTLRKRALCLVAAIQGVHQIYTEYGLERGRNLLGGFRSRFFVPEVESQDAVLASEWSGSSTVQKVHTAGSAVATQVVPTREPVIHPDEVIAKPPHPVLGPRITILLPGAWPFQAFLPASYQDPDLVNFNSATDFPPDRPNPLQSPADTPAGRPSASLPAGMPTGVTDTRGWPEDRIRRKLDEVKRQLDWDNATGSARKWWEAFEEENKDRASLPLLLAEELAVRKATISEFFLAYVYSNTNNIQANLHFLDYTRLKNEEERKKKEPDLSW
jgi:hypothetical protein